MEDQIKKLGLLIEGSNRILILSHTSPDPDALTSVLFTVKVIQNMFPAKSIKGNLEGSMSKKFKFLKDFDFVTYRDPFELIQEFSPELIILLDSMNFRRVTKNNPDKLGSFVKEKSIKLAIIDHHEKKDVESNDVYINNMASSCVEELYYVFLKELKYTKFEDYQNILSLGLYTDTGSFKYKPENCKRMFDFASEIFEDGANFEYIESKINKITMNHLNINAELARNVISNGEYTYSSISKEFVDKLVNLNSADYKEGFHMFYDNLKSIESAEWGFVLVPDKFNPKLNMWNGSFRSINGVIDTTVFSSKLNGGGHKAASGFAVESKTAEDAVKKVIEVIEKYKTEAYANK
jgi:phosphoesterase RecJ-like protein